MSCSIFIINVPGIYMDIQGYARVLTEKSLCSCTQELCSCTQELPVNNYSAGYCCRQTI